MTSLLGSHGADLGRADSGEREEAGRAVRRLWQQFQTEVTGMGEQGGGCGGDEEWPSSGNVLF